MASKYIEEIRDKLPALTGWCSVETAARKYVDPKLDMTKAQIENAAKNPPLPLPAHEGVKPEMIAEAWDKVSRLWPEMASEITRIGEYDLSSIPDKNSPPNAFINPHTGVLAVKPGKKLEPTTLWHELVHREQAIRGAIPPGGRLDMEPDEFDEIESEAYQRGNASADLIKRLDVEMNVNVEKRRDKQAALRAVAGGAEAAQMMPPYLPQPEPMQAPNLGKTEKFPNLIDLFDKLTHNGQFPSYTITPEDQQELEEVAGPELEAWRAERAVHEELPTINEKMGHRAAFEKSYNALRAAYLARRKAPETASAADKFAHFKLPATYRETLRDFQQRSPEGYAKALEAYRMPRVNMEQATRKHPTAKPSMPPVEPPTSPPVSPSMPTPDDPDLPATKLDVAPPSYLEGEEPERRTKIDPIQPKPAPDTKIEAAKKPAPDTQVASRPTEEARMPATGTRIGSDATPEVMEPRTTAKTQIAVGDVQTTAMPEPEAIDPEVTEIPANEAIPLVVSDDERRAQRKRREQEKMSRLLHDQAAQHAETSVEMPAAPDPIPSPEPAEGIPWARVFDDTLARDGEKKTHVAMGEPAYGPETHLDPGAFVQPKTAVRPESPSTKFDDANVYDLSEPPEDQPTKMPTFDIVEHMEAYDTVPLHETKEEMQRRIDKGVSERPQNAYRVEPQRAPHYAGKRRNSELIPGLESSDDEQLEALTESATAEQGTYGLEGDKKPLEDMWPEVRPDFETHVHMPVSEEQFEDLEGQNWRDRRAAQFRMPNFRDYKAGEHQSLSEWARPAGQKPDFSMPSANETAGAYSMPSMNETPGASSIPMGGATDGASDFESALEELVETVKKNTEALHKLIETLGKQSGGGGEEHSSMPKVRSSEFKGSQRKSTPHGVSVAGMLENAAAAIARRLAT